MTESPQPSGVRVTHLPDGSIRLDTPDGRSGIICQDAEPRDVEVPAEWFV